MFCVVLLMMGWCVPPLVALVGWPGSHRLEMNMYICQDRSTACPNFLPPADCLYIQRVLTYRTWLEAGTALELCKEQWKEWLGCAGLLLSVHINLDLGIILRPREALLLRLTAGHHP